MKKHNILFVINGLGCGGSQKNLTILANNFIECGCIVSIAVLLDDCPPFFVLDKRIKVINLVRSDYSRKKNIFFWRKELRKIQKKDSITDIISIGYRFGLICAFAKIRGCNLFVRGTITKKMNKIDSFLYKTFKKRFNKIVAQTNSQKLCYPASLRDKIQVIPNPFDTFSEIINKEGFFSKRLICIARLHLVQKRQDYIIKCLIPFFKKHSDFKIDFYGEPQIDDDGSTIKLLTKIIFDNNLQNNVFLNEPDGCVWDKCLPAFAFICASTKEGMPNAMIEGMARGVIPISTKWTGCEEIIDDHVNGFVGDSSDVSFIQRTLERLLENKEFYEQISGNAVDKVTKSYSFGFVLNKWKKILFGNDY